MHKYSVSIQFSQLKQEIRNENKTMDFSWVLVMNAYKFARKNHQHPSKKCLTYIYSKLLTIFNYNFYYDQVHFFLFVFLTFFLQMEEPQQGEKKRKGNAPMSQLDSVKLALTCVNLLTFISKNTFYIAFCSRDFFRPHKNSQFLLSTSKKDGWMDGSYMSEQKAIILGKGPF